ncbi:MAG: hypothetical protein NZV61_06940, partial [Candidatus Bipolaricaulota bacterium]|nr:hypothetical protein [Candidatus Bipolaricaulota bacterium]
EAAREQLASTYASLTCLVEQVDGPDLEVSLTVIVRRYTEREQVYCDFTVLTTVRNAGKGSAGGVALKEKAKARNWNNSKPNLYRYGMIGGSSVSSPPDIFTRMSPGTYEFEAEVESLDAKESNTRNNRVLRAVTCR